MTLFPAGPCHAASGASGTNGSDYNNIQYSNQPYSQAQGYYNTDGFHADMNTQANQVGTQAAGLTSKQISDIQAQNAQNQTSTGNTFQDALHQSRIPVQYAPGARPQTTSDSGVATGTIGWDEKLVDAYALSRTGQDAAQQTAAMLAVQGVMAMFQGMMDPAAAAAGKQILDESKKMVGVAGIFGANNWGYQAGKRMLVRDYKDQLCDLQGAQGKQGALCTTNTANNPTGSQSATASSGGGNSGSSGNQAIQTVDTAKDGSSPASSASTSLADQIKSQVLTPDLTAQLEAKGIDGAGLIDKFVAGDIDGQGFAEALGVSTDVSGEDKERADAMVADALGQAKQDASHPSMASSGKLKPDFFKTKAKVSNAPKRAFRLVSNSPMDDDDDDDGGMGRRRLLRGKNGKAPTREELEAMILTLEKEKALAEKATAGLDRALLSRGIQPTLHGQNIFQFARHNFRSYEKWRRQKETLAANTIN